MPKLTFHLLANAHLDPVWLWDWREGLNEGIQTVRTVLDLMDEEPELTFIRGEAAIYQHIEKEDPKTFKRLSRYVEAGRWDVVGGTYIQPDTNMPATETFLRHFEQGRDYFASRFGRAPRVGWAADSFGHSAGLPEILAKSGMTGFAFSRPPESQVKLRLPAFWWTGPSGAKVLAYRPVTSWYGTERYEIFRRLDGYLEKSANLPMQHVGCFYGLGNHGGGPTRRHLKDIRAWAERHPEVKIVHSGLHRFFDALATSERHIEGGYPVHRGELNYCLRGCYASVARFKFPYRKTEAHLVRAEKMDSAISAQLKRRPSDLRAAWESVLFNSFHDILPGSSIERAYEDQLAWLGAARHEAHRTELAAVNALAAQVDTTVPKPADDQPGMVPVLVWNPHPHVYEGLVELEASLDYRPIWAYIGKVDQVPVALLGPDEKPVPFQVIRNEHSAMPALPWRKRVVFHAKLPPLGWSVYRIGMADRPAMPAKTESPVKASADGVIENGLYRVIARKGGRTFQVEHKGRPIFAGDGVSVINVEDEWGSWGGMEEEPESLDLSKIQEEWTISDTILLEQGPERVALWVRFAGARSRIDFTISLGRKSDAVAVHARVFWNERSSRLKLVFPATGKCLYEVPGGVTERGIAGEVPGGRWVRCRGEAGEFGFASDALYGFDQAPGAFRATVVRATRYANDVKTRAEEEAWRPAVDAGELCFRFLLTTNVRNLPRLAAELEQPPVAQGVPVGRGALPRSGSLFSIEADSVQLIALKPAPKGSGWVARLQETAGKTVQAKGKWLGSAVNFGTIKPWTVNAYRLQLQRGRWKVSKASVA